MRVAFVGEELSRAIQEEVFGISFPLPTMTPIFFAELKVLISHGDDRSDRGGAVSQLLA